MPHPDHSDFLYCFEKACQREALKACPAIFFATEIRIFSADFLSASTILVIWEQYNPHIHIG